MIVFDLERFTRQPKDGERMIDLAAVGLLVLDSESEYDLTHPEWEEVVPRRGERHHAYYSDRLSTRVQRGMRSRPWLATPMAPPGDSDSRKIG